ncbi:MAG: hypothetical protein JXB47_18250 [Anaerolineae bacterium]|nr:hypothetical protein [Anaerolineae bacterium]
MGGTTCPYCGKSALAWWSKFFYNPLSEGACRVCGEPFTLPWAPAMAAYIPFVLVVLVGFLMVDAYLWAQMLAAGFVASGVVHVVWVPLVKSG